VLQSLLPAVRIPVHIVSGAHDPLVPPANGRYLAERPPDSRLSTLGTGHFAWEQVPGQYAALVADWVARADTPAEHQ